MGAYFASTCTLPLFHVSRGHAGINLLDGARDIVPGVLLFRQTAGRSNKLRSAPQHTLMTVQSLASDLSALSTSCSCASYCVSTHSITSALPNTAVAVFQRSCLHHGHADVVQQTVCFHVCMCVLESSCSWWDVRTLVLLPASL